jgi:hypothetical protein
MSETNKGVIWAARFSPMGSSGIIPLSPQKQITPAETCGIFILQLDEPGLPE